MLDENLPTFFFARSQGQPDHVASLYLKRGGQDPEPTYTVHHADPASSQSRNCYAVALFDAYNPSVIYGEVLLQPKWAIPTVTQENVRLNNGIPPPPEPLLPDEFTIQLYDPEVQVKVSYHPSSIIGSPHWDFGVPQDTFRSPSGSQLDRSQDDPSSHHTTPKVNFRWKRESKLSKEMTCYMTGKSTDMANKKKGRDPDITVAIFQRLKEITVYEPNLSRLEIEDPKGLEVVFLLAATTIKDVYFGNLRQAFSISEGESRRRQSSATANRPAAAVAAAAASAGNGRSDLARPQEGPLGAGAAAAALYGKQPGPAHGRPAAAAAQDHARPTLPARSDPGPPITDPLTQYEIDAETQRLRYQQEVEAARLRRQREEDRRARERADEEETKRLRKMVEEEAREARRHQKSIDKETERLKKIYGAQSLAAAGLPAASTAAQPPVQPPPRPLSAAPVLGSGTAYPQYPRPQNPQASAGPSSGLSMSGALQGRKPKKSIWGSRGMSNDDNTTRLSKKKSSVW